MSTHSHIRHIAAQRPATKGIFHTISVAYSVWRQRRALALLDASALKDIGLTQGEADIEASKPVWDVPQHWLR